MPDPIPDLWPEDIEKVQFRTPSAILGEQATKLSDRTAGLVTAAVRPLKLKAPSDLGLAFDLFSPILNYRFRLLNVVHKVTEIYPLTIFNFTAPGQGEDAEEIICADEKSFIEGLTKIFHSEKVVNAVRSLLAQSEGISTDPPF